MKQEFLDQTDLKLLDALQHDATLSNVALAERLKISPPTCLRRVKRLTDEGWRQLTLRWTLFFPAMLAPLRPLERGLGWLPLGAQYCLVAR